MPKRDPVLAQIHIAKKELGLDVETYRAILQRVTGKSSAGDLSATERKAVIAEFKRLGWEGGGSWKASSKPYVRKVFAVWGELKREGIWENKSRQALRAFVKKMTGCEDPEFMTYGQAKTVIEAMKAMLARGTPVSLEDA